MPSVHEETVDQKLSAVPDGLGRFGRFGGRYVPERAAAHRRRHGRPRAARRLRLHRLPRRADHGDANAPRGVLRLPPARGDLVPMVAWPAAWPQPRGARLLHTGIGRCGGGRDAHLPSVPGHGRQLRRRAGEGATYGVAARR